MEQTLPRTSEAQFLTRGPQPPRANSYQLALNSDRLLRAREKEKEAPLRLTGRSAQGVQRKTALEHERDQLSLFKPLAGCVGDGGNAFKGANASAVWGWAGTGGSSHHPPRTGLGSPHRPQLPNPLVPPRTLRRTLPLPPATRTGDREPHRESKPLGQLNTHTHTHKLSMYKKSPVYIHMGRNQACIIHSQKTQPHFPPSPGHTHNLTIPYTGHTPSPPTPGP